MVELYILGAIGVVVTWVMGKSVVKVVWRKVLRAKVKGRRGETKVKKKAKRISRHGGQMRNDILLPTDRGTSQIDHLLVTKHGIFVIETKNYSGIVEGHANSQMWRQYFPDGRTEPRYFLNPLIQNIGHIKALKDILGANKNIPIHSLVVFPDKCVFPEVGGVFSMRQLNSAIRFYSNGMPILDNKKIDEIVQKIDESNISGRKNREMHNFKAGLHTSNLQEVKDFTDEVTSSAVRLQFGAQSPPRKETIEEKNRHLLTDIYAKVKIQGKTDTIENFFEKAKRAEDGSPVPTGGSFDHFICPFTGDKFPASEANNFYQGLWITYLNKNPELVDFMKSYGAANLGNSYRCKKVLSLYDADKEGFIKTVRSSLWYQNMAKKRSKPSLSTQILNAERRTSQTKKDYIPKERIR